MRKNLLRHACPGACLSNSNPHIPSRPHFISLLYPVCVCATVHVSLPVLPVRPAASVGGCIHLLFAELLAAATLCVMCLPMCMFPLLITPRTRLPLLQRCALLYSVCHALFATALASTAGGAPGQQPVDGGSARPIDLLHRLRDCVVTLEPCWGHIDRVKCCVCRPHMRRHDARRHSLGTRRSWRGLLNL